MDNLDNINVTDLISTLWNVNPNDIMAQMHPIVKDNDMGKFWNNPSEIDDDNSDWYTTDEPHYNHDEGEEEYNPYGDDRYRINKNDLEWKDLGDDLPQYDTNDLKGDTNPFDYMKYYRWAINAVLIGLPWAITALTCLLYNLYFNWEYNRYWASGNYWLIGNTIYILWQTFASIPLVFELPLWIRAFRVARMMTFVSACLYNFVYLISFFEWYDQIYIVTDKSQYDFVTIFTNMMIGYNMVLHSSVVVVNLGIIIKEISLFFFNVSGKKRASDESRSLSGKDLTYFEKDVNPVTWVDVLWEKLFGYDVEDYVIENKNDEQHYYKNWAN